MAEKLEHLKSILKGYGKVAIAYSSGVDSTFLLKVAHDVLGENALAITVKSRLVPPREIAEATAFCARENIRHTFIEHDEMSTAGFAENPKNRCYVCKKAIFTKVLELARNNGFAVVCEGSNADDVNDYRPGMKAIAELSVKSPLMEAGLTKRAIRELSLELDLATWSKPSFACLASRIPYGEPITQEKLQRVEQAEQYLMDLGFSQFRVRYHQDNAGAASIARIEVPESEIEKILRHRTDVVGKFKSLGFDYVSVDLEGFRSGSLNKPYLRTL